MVQAWLMCDSPGDQREPNQRNPPEPVSIESLKELGVLYFRGDGEELKKIQKDRGYNYEDEIVCSREKMPDYDQKLKHFFTEHIHSDEEVRYVIEGSGYFDVRNRSDAWIRIWVEPLDLIVLPAGIYHRFTLDTKNFIRAKRLFQGEPVWTPINRPADEHVARRRYLEQLKMKG